MKVVFSLFILIPTLACADESFSGTWLLQPELTTFWGRNPEFLIERGTFRRTDCGKPIEIAATAQDLPVVGQPLFTSAAVQVLDARRVRIVERLSGTTTWVGLYAVSKDRHSMTLDFESDRAKKPVNGQLYYVREGEPLEGAHALSGSWRPEKLTHLSQTGMSLSMEQSEHELRLSFSDGSSIDSMLDAKNYPVIGYSPGATASILHSSPLLLAINFYQGGEPVEIGRAILSEDGNTLTYRHVDYVCRSTTAMLYRRQTSP